MRRNKKKIFAMLIFLLMSLIMFASANPSGDIEGLPQTKPTINIGGNDFTMEVYDDIPTFKATATDSSGNEIKVNIKHNIDNKKLGKYEVTFTTEDSNGNQTEIVEEFEVRDTTPPVIRLRGRALIKRILGYETYTDERADVTDNYDPARVISGSISGNPARLGNYYLLYNATDSSGNRARQVTRTIKMLAPNADEDGDGYTNLEELEDNKDYDDENDHPTYDKAPTIILDENNIYEMTVYDEIPTFLATATDVADGNVPVKITHNINKEKSGTYKVVFKAVDSLGNVKTIEKEFKVNKRKISVEIDDKESIYGETLEELTYTITTGTEVLPNAGIVLSKQEGINAGTYDISGTSSNEEYEVTFVNGVYKITAKELSIDDLGSYTFTDKTFDYDKTEHTNEVTGLPEGFTVEYNNTNKRTEAGTQDVKAIVTGTGNYTGTVTLTKKLIVTQAPVTVKADDINVTYGEPEKELTSTTTGKVYEGDTLNITLSRVAGNAVGTYTITPTAANANYNITLVNGTYTITAKELSIDDLGSYTFTDKTFDYDKTEHTNEVTGLPEGFTVEYNNTNKRTEAGTQDVKAIVTGTGNYTGTVTLTKKLIVTQAPVTVKADDINVTYGEPEKELTSTTTGKVYEGDTLNITLSRVAGNAVGTYTITPTAANANYNITLVNGTYTITAKELSIDDLGSYTFTDKTFDYDKTEHTNEVTGLPEGFTVEYNNTNKRTEAGTQDVKAIVTGTGNYTGTVTLTKKLIVTQAPVTVKADDINVTYGEPEKELTSTTTGKVYEGDTLNITLSRVAGNAVGTYTITPTAANANYNITLVNGTYTITAKELSIDDLGSYTFTDKTFDYDKTEHTNEVTGLPEGFTVEYNNTNKRTEAGTQDVKAIVTGTGNYTGTVTLTKKLIVTQAPVTVKADDINVTYGEPEKELTSTTTGKVYEGDTLNITLSRVAGNAVGTYTITPTAANANYNITLVNGTYTITPKTLEINDFPFNNKTVTYNKTEHKLEVTGLPEGFTVTYSDNVLTNAGEKPVTATITGSGNYTGTITKTATLKVEKANITFTAENKTSVYGSDIVALTYATDGTNYSNEITPTLTTTATNTSDVGTYDITITATNPNYNITLVNGTYTITPKTLEINDFPFNNKTVTYNKTEHKLEVTGLPEGFTVTYSDNVLTNAGEKPVTATITGSGNYTGTITKTATLKVEKANITFTAENKTSVYGSDIVELTYATDGTNYSNEITPTLTTTATNTSNVGTYNITITATNPNYNITLEKGTYTITKATPVVEPITGLESVIGNKLYSVTLPSQFTYKDADKTFTEAGNNVATVIFTPTDTANYNTVETTATIYVKDIFTVIFKNDDAVLKTESVIEGNNATAPTAPTKEGYTFDGWDIAFTNVQSNLVVNAKWKANQIGIVVEEKANVQLVFTQGQDYNIEEYINVYPKYADNTVGTIPIADYTTDFNNSTHGNKTLTVTQTSTTFTGTIPYSVTADIAYQTKFEAKHTPNSRTYRATKTNGWGNYYCTSNCDSENNTFPVTTTFRFLEIIEHYEQNIVVESVRVKYKNEASFGSPLDKIKNGRNDYVRYSKKQGSSYYDPVYIYEVDNNKDIDLVKITYTRADYGKFEITFKYEAAGNLRAISEQKQ